MLAPEFAWLSVAAQRCIRLPVGLAELRGRIAESQASTATVPVGLTRPLGQFLWSLACSEDDAVAQDRATGALRMPRLRQFCERHWPGWFTSRLGDLELDVHGGDGPECLRHIERLRNAASPVAACECFSELFHGAGRDIVNSGAGQTLALLKYHRTAPQEDRSAILEMLVELLRTEDWWTPLQAALAAVGERLADVAVCGFDPESILKGRLGDARQGLTEFIAIAEGLARSPSELAAQLSSAEGSLARVVSSITSIEAEARALRASLAGGTGAEPTPC